MRKLALINQKLSALVLISLLVGSPSPAFAGGVDHLETAYRNFDCPKTMEIYKSDGVETGATGTRDTGSEGQRGPLCTTMKLSLMEAKNQRVNSVAYGISTGVCAVACAFTWLGDAGYPACLVVSLLATGTQVANDINFSNEASDLNQNVDKNTFGDIMANFMKGAAGVMVVKTVAAEAAKIAARLAAKEMGTAAAKEAGKKASSQQTGSCVAAGFSAFSMFEAIKKKDNAIKAGLDQPSNLADLRSRFNNAAVGGPMLRENDRDAASANRGERGRATASGAHFSDGTPDDTNPCPGAGTSGRLLLNCAVAKGGFPGFDDDKLHSLLDKNMPGGLDNFMNKDFNGADDAMKTMVDTFGGSNPNAMKNILEVGKELSDKGQPQSDTSYSQAMAAPSNLKFGGEDKSMEDMMAMVNGMMNPKAGEEQISAAKLDFSLHVKYMSDPNKVTEDREISIFRRVTYRYNSVGEAQRLAINLPPRGSNSVVGQGQYPTTFQGTQAPAQPVRNPAQFR